MTNEQIRLMLLQQRRLFGSNDALADALHVSGQALSQFLSRQNALPRADSKIIKALGLEVVTQKVLKPTEEL